jgi:predicted Zn-dependent protease
MGITMQGAALEGKTGTLRVQHHWKPTLILLMVAGGVFWGGWKWWEFRSYRRDLAEIEDEIRDNRHGTAARKLHTLLAWQPDSDEALSLLGTCEFARGRLQAAADAWTRVRPGSRFAPQAILGRLQCEMERGRLAEAEQIVRDALEDPRIDGASLPILLGPVYCQQGRVDETLALIETRWDALNKAGQGASEPAIQLARAHVELRSRIIPVEVIRAALDQAAGLAPEDDRVWLGKADLAIRLGSYDEAAKWLDDCSRRRPQDVPVWRARLKLARAVGRVADAREAMRHLPANEFDPAEVRRLVAWLAGREGDTASELRELERLYANNSAGSSDLDRLAEMAAQQGQPTRAAEYRNKKTENDRLEARYQKLHQRNQPLRDSAEMASLAERLGLWFEARAFATVAVAVDPERQELRSQLVRIEEHLADHGRAGHNLADLVATKTR